VQSSWPCPRCGVPVAPGVKFCASCGAPIIWALPSASPPKSTDSKAVLIVIVIVVLVILVPIVLSALLYIMVSGLIGGPDPGATAPSVVLSSQGCVPGTCTAVVNSASRPVGFAELAVTLLVNGTPVASDQGLGTLPISGPGYRLRFSDTNTGGVFDTGDQFLVEGVVPGGTYEIQLLWFDTDVFVPVAGVVLSP